MVWLARPFGVCKIWPTRCRQPNFAGSTVIDQALSSQKTNTANVFISGHNSTPTSARSQRSDLSTAHLGSLRQPASYFVDGWVDLRHSCKKSKSAPTTDTLDPSGSFDKRSC